MQTPKFIMIHHSAVSYERNPDQFEANNSYHKEQWNFKSSLGFYLGYNYEIAKLGKVRLARKDGEETAACYQGNMNDGRCIHICLDGNFDIEKPMPVQIYALRDLLKALVKKYGINKNNIVFHNQYAPKSCPGKNMDLVFVRSMVSSNAIKEAVKQSIQP
jgi:N-acetylmuramoyl-L-alanine amidase